LRGGGPQGRPAAHVGARCPPTPSPRRGGPWGEVGASARQPTAKCFLRGVVCVSAARATEGAYATAREELPPGPPGGATQPQPRGAGLLSTAPLQGACAPPYAREARRTVEQAAAQTTLSSVGSFRASYRGPLRATGGSPQSPRTYAEPISREGASSPSGQRTLRALSKGEQERATSDTPSVRNLDLVPCFAAVRKVALAGRWNTASRQPLDHCGQRWRVAGTASRQPLHHCGQR
jgi:hypothetical protein